MAGYLTEMFAVSLALTVAVEVAVVCLFLRISIFQTKENENTDSTESRRNWIRLVVLLNILTNPPAVLFCWLARMYLPPVMHFPVQLAVEAAVVILEAGIYDSFTRQSRWKGIKPVLLSAAANGCSWLGGMFLMALRN